MGTTDLEFGRAENVAVDQSTTRTGRGERLAVLPASPLPGGVDRRASLRTGAARTRQARERLLSLTDCVSFEVMLAHGCRAALDHDEEIQSVRFTPSPTILFHCLLCFYPSLSALLPEYVN